MNNKFLSPDEMAELIKDRSTVWLSGCGGGINDPDIFLSAIEKRFINTHKPCNLTLYHSAGIGNKKGGGVDRFAHPGLVCKVVGSHWTWSRQLQKMAKDNEVEAYVMPQGVMTQLTREIAAHRVGLITKVGLGTFIDPRNERGAINEISKDSVAEVVELSGDEYLLYKSFPIDVSIIRGAKADCDGNISLIGEGLISEALSQAQAAYNSGGIVLCQVKEKIEGRLKPYEITIPSKLITAVCVCPEQTFSYSIEFDDRLTGADSDIKPINELLDDNEAKNIIAKEVLSFLNNGDVVNLGFGLPSIVGSFARADSNLSDITFTLEQGIIGGVPLTGANFGVAYYPEAFVPEPNQFDWYDGGAIDTAVLSFAQFDQQGNVNVSKINGYCNGVGGFINIAQGAKKVVFVGTFTTSGLVVSKNNDSVDIIQEGRIKKLVKEVDQISFSGMNAVKEGKQVFFVTERASFELTLEGIRLIKVMNGIDLNDNILSNMDFVPIIR